MFKFVKNKISEVGSITDETRFRKGHLLGGQSYVDMPCQLCFLFGFG